MRRTTIIAAALLLAGCISSAPAPEVAAAPRRQLTAPEKATISHAVAMQMKDPEAAKFLWAPLIVHTREGVIDYCALVNGKNSYGGYVGFHPAYVQLRFDSKGDLMSADLRLLSSGPDEQGFDPAALACGHFGYGDLKDAK